MKQMITTFPNQELYQPTRDIPKKDIRAETFSQIGSAMLDILRKEGGIGLSANQVGLPLNICVIELEPNNPMILLNPRVTKTSVNKSPSKEGCLSLPGALVTVQRYNEVTVEYEDVTGETQAVDADGLFSCCLQHEIDHLNGVLTINRIGAYHKEKALKQISKFKKIRNGSKR
jgi:peptide deformylase